MTSFTVSSSVTTEKKRVLSKEKLYFKVQIIFIVNENIGRLLSTKKVGSSVKLSIQHLNAKLDLERFKNK